MPRGSKPGEHRGGRKKGTKNRTLREPGQRATEALAAAFTSASRVATNDRNVAKRRRKTRVEVAGDGISPLDVMLIAMRGAWDAAHAKVAQIKELEKEVAELEKEAAAEPPLNAQDAGLARLDVLRKQITSLRLEVGHHVSNATNLAKDVAPYEHPKLANQDSKVTAPIQVVIRKF